MTHSTQINNKDHKEKKTKKPSFDVEMQKNDLVDGNDQKEFKWPQRDKHRRTESQSVSDEKLSQDRQKPKP